MRKRGVALQPPVEIRGIRALCSRRGAAGAGDPLPTLPSGED